VKIDAVEKRAADFGEVALNNAGRAAAFAGRIPIESTGTPLRVSIGALNGYIGRQSDEQLDYETRT
jgi:hypothetical protein